MKIIKKKNGNELNKINQIYISNDLGKFDLVMRKKYNLNAYHNSNKPAFFFGLYNQVDFGIISNHKSTAVIIWGGTDAQMIHNWDLKRISYFFPGDIKMLSEENKNIWKKIIETHEPSLIDKIDLNHVQIEMKENIPIKFYNLLFKDNIRYLAISNNIAESLEKLNLSYKRANISFVDVDKFSPVEKGDSVYIYTSNNCPDIYGKEIYDVVKKKMPTTKFIICNSSTYDDIFEIYKKCFIGLRLTSHDGNANTVQELGLCGIKCVHNSDYPNAIPWSCVDDIIKIVEMEKKNIGKKDDELAMRMKEYLKTYNNDWLCKSFYD